MKKSILRLFFINALITTVPSNTLANDDCLIIGEVKSISSPYNVYFENHETSSVIEYQVELENRQNVTDISEYGSPVDTIEVYSEINRCRKKFYFRPCCISMLVGKYNYARKEWASFDDCFHLDYQNKTLSLTVQNPKDLYITMKLMSNNSIVHSDTTHLMHKPADYYNLGQCLEPYNQCREQMSGGIESVEMIEGPGLYRRGKNSYILLVNPDETAYDKYKYKIAFKIKTSEKKPYHGLVFIDNLGCPDLYAKILWMKRNGQLLRYGQSFNWDSYNFEFSSNNETIIFYNYSQNFVNRSLSLHVVRSGLPAINIYVIKDDRPQSCARFLSDGQTLIPQEPFVYPKKVEQCLEVTTVPPSKLATTIPVKVSERVEQSFQITTAYPSEAATKISATVFNITAGNEVRNQTGNSTYGSDGSKTDILTLSLLGVSLILGTLGHH